MATHRKPPGRWKSPATYTHEGVTRTLSEWARIKGISVRTLQYRLAKLAEGASLAEVFDRSPSKCNKPKPASRHYVFVKVELRDNRQLLRDFWDVQRGVKSGRVKWK